MAAAVVARRDVGADGAGVMWVSAAAVAAPTIDDRRAMGVGDVWFQPRRSPSDGSPDSRSIAISRAGRHRRWIASGDQVSSHLCPVTGGRRTWHLRASQRPLCRPSQPPTVASADDRRVIAAPDRLCRPHCPSPSPAAMPPVPAPLEKGVSSSASRTSSGPTLSSIMTFQSFLSTL